MNKYYSLTVLALALGLGGCASMSSNYQSDVRYQDGSYYSPANDGYGDYYYAPEQRYDYYYDHSYFYGSPFYSFGGFCSIRYRYCPPFGYDPFGMLSFGWYDPFWGPYRYSHWHHGHRHHGRDNRDDDQDDDQDQLVQNEDSDADDVAPRPRLRGVTGVPPDRTVRRGYQNAEPQMSRPRAASAPRRSERASKSSTRED